MLKVNTVQTNFSSGELSPWLLGRSDIERYLNGAEVLENFYVKPQGGIVRRRGSRYKVDARSQDSTATVRLIDFVFSDEDSAVIEIGPGYFKIHTSEDVITDPVVEFITGTDTYPAPVVPYLSAHINELQFTKSADVLYITHPDYPPATLSHYGPYDWRYELITAEYGPYIDQTTGDQDISLTVANVTDRVRLTSNTAGDFTGRVAGDFVEYAYNGQKVLGLVSAVYSGTVIDVEPLEDRSLILSKEVYSPGLYFGWDATNNIPTYTGTIAGSDVDVAFSAVGVIAQEQIGNYLRFCDRSGTYYWMLVNGVKDILRQGAYGIIANGDVLTVHRPAGIVTRGDRRINARLKSSEAFFDLSTDADRLFRLVIGNTVVHARGRSKVTYTATGNNVNGQARINLGWNDAGIIMPGDTITGTGIPANTTIVSAHQDVIQSYAVLSNNCVTEAFTVLGTSSNGSTRIETTSTYTARLLVGDQVTGTGIPGGSTITAVASEPATEFSPDTSYFDISAAATSDHSGSFTITSPTGPAGVTYTINASTTTNLGVTLNRSIPRSVEGLTVVQNGTTNDWNRGAWYTGNYPRTVCFHEGRLGFAGTSLQPQTVWLSRTDDIYNFGTTDEKLRVFDDAAITFTIASDTVNQIAWMQSRQVLLIGSISSEWRVSSTTPGAPLTPTTVSVSSQSSYGSEPVKPLSIGRACIYLQRGGCKLREMSYEYQTDSQVSVDLTVYSEHILRDHGGAVQLAYQPLPDSMIYALLADGQIAVLTYEPDQKVYAWSRFVIGGPEAVVESIACVPSSQEYTYDTATSWDEDRVDPNHWLYILVRRKIKGTWIRTIEYLDIEYRPTSDTDRERMVFMDGFVIALNGSLVSPTYTTISVGDLYELTTVSVVADDLVADNISVDTNGALTLPKATRRYVWVGFPFTTTLKTFPIEAPAQAGTGQGKYKRIHKITLRLRDTIDFNHGSDTDDLREESFRTAEDPTDTSPPLFTGDYTLEYEDGYDTRGAYYITQDKAYPLTILSLMPEFAQMQ